MQCLYNISNNKNKNNKSSEMKWTLTSFYPTSLCIKIKYNELFDIVNVILDNLQTDNKSIYLLILWVGFIFFRLTEIIIFLTGPVFCP